MKRFTSVHSVSYRIAHSKCMTVSLEKQEFHTHSGIVEFNPCFRRVRVDQS